jgi:RimJ/RimL family protein N-acetyltransferase
MDDKRMLLTPRLLGRPISFLDFGRLRSIHGDPRAATTLSVDGLPFSNAHSRRSVQSWTQHWQEHGFGVWMFHKPDGEFIGYAGLMRSTIDGLPEVEMLYAIRSDFWRDGYATEMATAVARFAFDSAGLRELVAFTLPTNIGSRRVMEKCGFQYERDIVHAVLPHVLYRLRSPKQDQA